MEILNRGKKTQAMSVSEADKYAESVVNTINRSGCEIFLVEKIPGGRFIVTEITIKEENKNATPEKKPVTRRIKPKTVKRNYKKRK